MGDFNYTPTNENDTLQSELGSNLPQNKQKTTPSLSDRTLVIISVTIFLLFALSFIFSFQSPLMSPPTGIWTLPFIFISMLPTFPAWLIGGFTCYPASLDLIKCNNQLIYVLYFFFSALYALTVFLFIRSLISRNIKSSLIAFFKPTRFKILVLIVISLYYIISPYLHLLKVNPAYFQYSNFFKLNNLISTVSFGVLYFTITALLPLYLLSCVINLVFNIFKRWVYERLPSKFLKITVSLVTISIVIGLIGAFIWKELNVASPPTLTTSTVTEEERLSQKIACPQDSYPIERSRGMLNNFQLIKSAHASIRATNYILSRLCFLEKPILDKPVKLKYNFVSSVNVASASAKLTFPKSFTLVSGDLEWQGSLQVKQEQSIEALVNADHWGSYLIEARVDSNQQGLFSPSSIDLHISPNDVVFGYDNFPNNEWYEEYSLEYRRSDKQGQPKSVDTNQAKGALLISNTPALNKEFTVTYQVTSQVELPNAEDNFLALTFPPEAFEVINVEFPPNGEGRKDRTQFNWKGKISKNETVAIKATLRVKNTGWGSIYGVLDSRQGNSYSTLDKKAADFYVNQNGAGTYLPR